MQCPLCDFRSSVRKVQCPEGHAEYSAGELEELNHLYYLRDWIEYWKEVHVLPKSVASNLQAIAGRQARELEGLLGVGQPAIPPPVMQAPVAAPSVTPAPVSPYYAAAAAAAARVAAPSVTPAPASPTMAAQPIPA